MGSPLGPLFANAIQQNEQNEFPQTAVESEISRYMSRKTSENVGEPSAEQVKPEKRCIVLSFVHRNAEDFGIRL